MPVHAVFFTFPLHGHVNPTLGLVAELVRRGHRVTYATTPEFAGAVAGAGARPLIYDNVMPRSLDLVIKPPGEVSHEEFHASILTITDEGFAPLDQAHDALDGDRPDVVLHDLTAFHTGRALALRWGVPAVQLCTTIVFNEAFNPYLRFTGLHPEIDPAHPAITGEREVVVKALAGQGLDMTPEQFRADQSAVRASLVFLPRELQVGQEHFGPEYAFVGPCLSERAFQGEWVPTTPRDPQRPLVVVAFGTFGYTSQGRLFAECVREFADKPWQVVLVVGNRVDPAELEPLPDNVEVHRWVPQLALLAETDVFVSHAGMGSVVEALWTRTPVVLLPQLTEQDLVAEQVAELGVGRVVPREELGGAAVAAAVESLLADDGIGERLDRLRAAMVDAGGAVAAADVVEGVAQAG
ncbi:hypothetical protein BJP25_16205 [Actinokineospora bangkokensis]|uniref:Erythromycin biosynthesis protein CIII-like C-terminal domain-containing protein n=1 Tax=Actinokineospora bangkokensis TaxID=1193682 RepID=A0A1Q9LPF4_9PSEU|nr:hypothetical protein BJP25_16205 [Actinokineospora bangkokensis]